MTDPINPQRLAEIQAREQAASEGPWNVDCHIHIAQGCRCLSCYDAATGWYLTTGTTLCCDEAVAKKGSDENGWEPKNDFGRPLTSCEDGPFISFEDADFAAHAREDVPFLLAEVARLTQEAADAHEGRELAEAQRDQLQADIDATIARDAARVAERAKSISDRAAHLAQFARPDVEPMRLVFDEELQRYVADLTEGGAQ
jgi:hypothetical protein